MEARSQAETSVRDDAATAADAVKAEEARVYAAESAGGGEATMAVASPMSSFGLRLLFAAVVAVGVTVMLACSIVAAVAVVVVGVVVVVAVGRLSLEVCLLLAIGLCTLGWRRRIASVRLTFRPFLV